ncbi:scavenger receptor cysteine-rich type 1 protein M130 isoform X2 [Betta splendens]|uniref:Scavenger receptor cysteine-rich type 1 protein M130 isoform X2 n=1 Tax=Betta splendens TaxID=158456 RepID=A0A6P7N1C5_BETSP|nr:scavenger receptor cysteine-rich type 1 protein M130 isoform X2 [Betta splendens]
MWFLVLLVCITGSGQVVQGKNWVVLKNSDNPSDPCEGHVQIYHNMTWGYAGDSGWNDLTEEVVCRSTRCGKPLEQPPEHIQMPPGSKVWLNEMKCTGKEQHLWECSLPGWGISKYPKQTVRKIKCSDRIGIALDGFRCAGAVQYSINKTLGYFCSEKWGQAEANRVCKSLGCGKSKGNSQPDWLAWKGFQSAKKATIDCSSIEKDIDHLWQCVTETSTTCKKPALVECEGHEKLQLSGDTSNACSGMLEIEANGKWERNGIKTSPDVWCQQMNCGIKRNHTQKSNGTEVNCSDKVKVQLVDDSSKPSNCYGRVSILLNGSDFSVCDTNWDSRAGEVVCRELGCGKVIVADKRTVTKPGIMDNVKCLGSESSLWHCQAKHDKLPRCSSSAYVVCEKSLDVRLKDGPGKCAGRMEIQYQGAWRKVKNEGWTESYSNFFCEQLKCGEKGRTAQAKEFSQGSSAFFPWKVQCETGASHISDCIKGPLKQDQSEWEAVGLICEDHKVVILEGSASCSGLVGIEHASRTYWLSGSNTTWNAATAELVCQQRHCGGVTQFGVISNSDMRRDVWNKSVTCSVNHTSLFECDENEAAPDHNETIANVTCSGHIAVKLSNGCWGHVNVSMGNQWGGVCTDAWGDAKSLRLCKDLGCGDKILTPISIPGGFPVILNSLHDTKQETKLSKCNIVKDEYNDCKKGAAYVICSGSVQTRITDARDSCSGNVEVFYGGQWLPVCGNALDSSTQDAICQEQECGQADKKIPYVGPKPANTLAISELSCPTGLKTCSVKSAQERCTLSGLQCSNWSKTTLRDTCSGDVMLYTHDDSRHDPGIWTEGRAHSLCNSLNCGNMETLWTNIKTNDSLPALRKTVIKCDDKPNVTLSGTCRGVVKISNIEVCSATWTEDHSHKVCQQLGCSNAVAGVAHVNSPSPNAEYYHVTCDSFHSEIGQCKRHKDKCNEKLVSVSCVNSIKFNTTHKCGGWLQVNYQDKKWEYVCPFDNPQRALMNMLCKAINCGNYNESIKSTSDLSKKLSKPLNAKIHYTEDYMNVSHCVLAQSCEKTTPARIFCNGYVSPVEVQNGPPVSIVSIMLGVGFVLILVILAIIFVRIWFIKKRGSTVKYPLRMHSQHEMEFESGEFEQIKDGEMESFSHNRFRSESEVIMENRLSASSLPYDDIDEVAQPLTAAGSSGGNNPHEEADGATYEVEDPHESYDDIDADPDVTQTRAEVHDGAHSEAEGPAAACHQAQQDGDYLVPGQDG